MFGNTHIIKAAVFSEIELQADQQQFDNLRRMDLSSFTPFIKKVTFLPSPFSSTFDAETFGEIMRTMVHNRINLPYHCKKHMKNYWDGSVPSTDREISAAYRDHVRQGRIDRGLARLGELQCFWTMWLRAMQHAEHFEVSSLIGRHPLLPLKDECGVDSYPHLRCSLRAHSNVNGDDLFRTAVQCLAHSGRDIKSFSVNSEIAQNFVGWSLPSWNQLSFQGLETFKFPSYGFWDEAAGKHARNAIMDDALGHIFRKSFPQVRDMHIYRNVAYPCMNWPPRSGLNFPRLGSLSLQGLELKLPWLGALVVRCRQLHTIYMRDCTPAGNQQPGGDGWRPLFDGIRHRHPTTTPINVTLESVWDWYSHGFSLSFNSNTALGNRRRDYGEYENELELYMANRGPWTENLRSQFEEFDDEET